MASSYYSWIALVPLLLMTSDVGVFGRAVDTRGFLSESPEIANESPTPTLRTEAHRQQCAELSAPWLENTQALQDNSTLLQLRVRPFSPGVSRGLVFPGKSLFSFVRRVYRCCQEGLSCRSVKGIQGRQRGDTDVEFLLTSEILSLTVMRAELHLQLSNPQHLDVRPVLPFMAKRNLPTRYSMWSRGHTVELRVDLLFLLQILQEAAGGAGGGPSLMNMRRVMSSPRGDPGALQDTDGNVWGDGVAIALPAPELGLGLGLVLDCSHGGVGVSCKTSGVHLSHTPFMALYYR